MTPDTLAFLGSLLDRYGLPVLMLTGLGWLLLTRRLTLGSETSYVEDRRREERDGRLLAEKALQEHTDALAKLTDSVERLADTVEERRARR